eukprot:m.134412 g.134412  ORF g.134412 m.134412 type:complete len:397 (+) comp16915_c0_seq1:1279-2469(+)
MAGGERRGRDSGRDSARGRDRDRERGRDGAKGRDRGRDRGRDGDRDHRERQDDVGIRRDDSRDGRHRGGSRREVAGPAGPQMPPELLERLRQQQEDEEEGQGGKKGAAGIGPMLPPHLRKPESNEDQDSGSRGGDTLAAPAGPALPPGFARKSPSRPATAGPTLPEHLRKTLEQPPTQSADNTTCDGDDGDDDVVGPLPPRPEDAAAEQEAFFDTVRAFEERSLKQKERLTNTGPAPVQRESWMLELPEARRKNFGAGARTFRRTTADEVTQDSSWTDTPADVQRKKQEAARRAQLGKEQARKRPAPDEDVSDQKQAELAARLADYNKRHRGQSLVEMHQTKQRQEAKERGKTEPVRQRFNRETDLEARSMDPRKKSDMLKGAQQFKDRFSAAKFL